MKLFWVFRNKFLYLFFLFIHFIMFIYFWKKERERERERAWVEEGQRDRERQNLRQAPGFELLAQSLTWCSNSQTLKSWPELKLDTQLTEPPRCPYSFIFKISILKYLEMKSFTFKYTNIFLKVYTFPSSVHDKKYHFRYSKYKKFIMN